IDYEILKKNALDTIYRPPIWLLAILITTAPVLTFGIMLTPYYAGDLIIATLLCLILLYCGILHWNALWLLYNFLRISSRFGKDIFIKINPFDPDKVGGLAPLSGLSTLAIFDVGLLAVLAIPAWQIFLPIAAYVMIFLTSLLMPIYFLLSMQGIYKRLKEEKEKTLNELNDEIQSLSNKIRMYIRKDHSQQMDEKEMLTTSQALNSMEIIYNRVSSMHTFPINWEIIAKIFLSAILPILAVLIDFLLTKFL
ncbi:MAG: hypothetical protein QW279_00180, partial [Candidatus Jordarchaeaceae archaeon]